MNMLIATDIGNSSITIGYFSDRGLLVQRIPTLPLKKSEEYQEMMNSFIRENNINKSGCNSIISSVVLSHTEVLTTALKGLSGRRDAAILVVNHTMTGTGFKILNPEKLGTDRIANAVAAFSLVRKPVAVIDFGTATTISIVNGNGDYIGGSIMPGIGLMNESLGAKTSKLKLVDIQVPETALGKDTEACIRTGLLVGTAGAVERIVSEIEKETDQEYSVVLTGGHASLIDRFISRPHIMNLHLTLEGLKILYEKNRPQ
jgi:type III pantothenate kinase